MSQKAFIIRRTLGLAYKEGIQQLPELWGETARSQDVFTHQNSSHHQQVGHHHAGFGAQYTWRGHDHRAVSVPYIASFSPPLGAPPQPPQRPPHATSGPASQQRHPSFFPKYITSTGQPMPADSLHHPRTFLPPYPPPPPPRLEPQPQIVRSELSQAATLQKPPLSQRSKPLVSDSMSLNRAIMACGSVSDLLGCVRDHGHRFDFFNISSAISRVPKLLAPHGVTTDVLDGDAKLVIDELANLMHTHIASFDARGLANASWAFGKLKYAPPHDLAASIAQHATARITEFSPQNMSNMVWAFVYMRYRDEGLLKAVASAVVNKLPEFKPQELANLLWAYANLDVSCEQLLSAAAMHCPRIMHLFKEQELANALWAFARLRYHDRDLYNAFLAEVKRKLPHFMPQGVSNIAWALASTGHRDPQLFDLIAAHCMRRLRSFDVQALSNLVWSMASLGCRQPVFLDAAIDEMLTRTHETSPQNVSNVLWSCATLGHSHPRMMPVWAAFTVAKVQEYEPQGLSNSAWAFAKLGYYEQSLFHAIAAAATPKLSMFTSQGLSNTAWAFAAVQHYDGQLMDKIADQVVAHTSGLNVQNCSVTAWAFATLRHHSRPLFDAVLNRLVGERHACEPQNVANLLWAYARMGHSLREHAGTLCACTQQLMDAMNQQELCNSMWALAVLGLLDVPLFKHFCTALGDRHTELSGEGLHQAYHAQMMFHSALARQMCMPASLLVSSGRAPALPVALQAAAELLWQRSARDVHVSRLQQDVSRCLQRAGVPNALEWLTDDGLFSIDIAFQVGDTRIALEVDGSHHYTCNPPITPLSDVDIRKRLLQDRGWTVVNLGFQEWDALSGVSGACTKQRAFALVRLIMQRAHLSRWSHPSLPSRGGWQPSCQQDHGMGRLGCDCESCSREMMHAPEKAGLYSRAHTVHVQAGRDTCIEC